MKIAYYLNEGRKKNLYCRITDGSDRVTFSLDHTVDPKEWNIKKEEIEFENAHHFTLHSLKSHLTNLYHQYKIENKEDILSMLKTEAETLMDGHGLKGIDRNLFDRRNKEFDVPMYDDFMKAFEKHTGLTSDQYKAETLGSLIHFHTKDGVFKMDTYQGLQQRLMSFIDRRSYDEILLATKEYIWSEVYKTGEKIEKHEFLPLMFKLWERHWGSEYSEIKKKLGKTDHLDGMKADSWRALQVFMGCYDGAGDPISLAHEINESELYALAVVTMLELSDADACYQEYCAMEFENAFTGGDEWESINISDDEDDWESPIFYIRPYEF